MPHARRFTKPIVVVSRCLGFAACRWEGKRLSNSLVRRLKPYVRFLPVCPELEIGLGVPRDPIYLVRKGKADRLALCQPSTGRDLTDRMNRFAAGFVSSIKVVDGFILKAKSPSCGTRRAKIFGSLKRDSRIVGRGHGLFASAVLEALPYLAIENEKRLADLKVREAWLTKLFALADFRAVKNQPSANKLAGFHSRHQLLLQAHNRKRTAVMSQLVKRCTSAPIERAVSAYKEQLLATLSRRARVDTTASIFAETLNRFSDHLTTRERIAFRNALTAFCNGVIGTWQLRKTIQVWGVRYDKSYLRQHSFFRPYPPVLMDEE